MKLEIFLYYFMMNLWWPRQWIYVIGNINDNISNNIHPYKYIKGSMGQWYSYSTKQEKNIVAILHTYGARSIFTLFYDDQDTESE